LDTVITILLLLLANIIFLANDGPFERLLTLALGALLAVLLAWRFLLYPHTAAQQLSNGKTIKMDDGNKKEDTDLLDITYSSSSEEEDNCIEEEHVNGSDPETILSPQGYQLVQDANNSHNFLRSYYVDHSSMQRPLGECVCVNL
jgi:hypothetical protein